MSLHIAFYVGAHAKNGGTVRIVLQNGGLKLNLTSYIYKKTTPKLSTITIYILCRWFISTPKHTQHKGSNTPNAHKHARGQAVMEGGDNVGGSNNDVGEGASSVAAADPCAPSDGAAAAAAAGGGGVVDNSSPVVEVGNGLTATTQTVHSENGTPVTVKVVKTAAGNRAKRSWVWQVMHDFSLLQIWLR